MGVAVDPGGATNKYPTPFGKLPGDKESSFGNILAAITKRINTRIKMNVFFIGFPKSRRARLPFRSSSILIGRLNIYLLCGNDAIFIPVNFVASSI